MVSCTRINTSIFFIFLKEQNLGLGRGLVSALASWWRDGVNCKSKGEVHECLVISWI